MSYLKLKLSVQTLILVAFSFTIVLPVLYGLLQSLFSSIGLFTHLEGINSITFSFWVDWFEHSSSIYSSLLSVYIAFISSALALFFAWIFLAVFHHPKRKKYYGWVILILALPHLALAYGLQSTYKSSGIISSILSLAGFGERSFDAAGSSQIMMMIATLVIKETAFLIFIATAELSKLNVEQILRSGYVFGYSKFNSYTKLILPQIHSAMKLAILMVMSYALVAVEIPLVFSGIRQQPDSINVYNEFVNPQSLSSFLTGFAGSIWLIVLFGVTYLLWTLMIRGVKWLGQFYLVSGNRRSPAVETVLPVIILFCLILCCALPLIVQVLWSFTGVWRYPAILPQAYSASNYAESLPGLALSAFNSLILAFCASALGLILAVAIIELFGKEKNTISRSIKAVTVLPLILPQLSFLFGFQILLESIDISGTWAAMIWSNFIFCFGYCYLIMLGHDQEKNERYMYTAYSLGISRVRAWFKVKLFLMLPTIKVALGLSMSVSLMLYLPTLFSSSGRYMTLVTEMIGLLNSSNPKYIATYSITLAIIPCIIFYLSGCWRRIN